MSSFIKILKFLFYIFLISPPNAIDFTASQRAAGGELAKQPLFVVMFIELFIRIALVLIIATSFEELVGNDFYEMYLFDLVFLFIVVLGIFHSLSYYIFIGYLRIKIGLNLAFRIYRYIRNFCYSALPGLITVIPVLIWKLKMEQPPFEDDLVLNVYLITTFIMIGIGMLEALLMTRKPLGLDRSLKN